MDSQAVSVQSIQNTIITLPGREPFMLGQDLAAIYETEPKYITLAVKRNPTRFDDDFVFQLTNEEVEVLRLQSATANFAKMRSNPFGFTQAGANMLSVVLKSPVAIQRSKQIIRAFTAMEVKAASAEFKAARDALKKARQAERRAQLDYQEARTSGKLVRREETDAIKHFIGYAKAQGSKSAEMYYVSISSMVNRELFGLKPEHSPKNFRETLTSAQLDSLKMADRVVAQALYEGMDAGLPYKEIFALAKNRVKSLVTAIGRSVVLGLIGSPANTSARLLPQQ